MKSLIDLIRMKELPPFVGEIIDADVPEVAAVDTPATDIQWRFFKSAKSGIPAHLAPGADYTADLATGVQPTPTYTESRGDEPDDPFNRREVMTADMAGHDAKVPVTKSVLRQLTAALERGELGRKATFDECVESVMSRPGFEPQEGHTPEESARAICATKPGGPQEGKAAEETRMTRKDVAAPVAPTEEELLSAGTAPELPTEADVLEIPAAPEPWKYGDCVNFAQETLEMSEGAAKGACDLVKSKFGDPTDPATILIPDGNDAASLISAAAYEMGPDVYKSIKAEHRKAPAKGLTFRGKNHWFTGVRKFLGLDNEAPAVTYMKAVEARQEAIEMAQEKASRTMEELLAQNRQMLQIIAADRGVNIADVAAAASADPAAPAPVPAAGTGNPLMDGKAVAAAPACGAKDGAAAGAPAPPAPPAGQLTEEQMAAMLKDPQIVALLNSIATGELSEEDLPDLVGAAPAPPAAPGPMKRLSVVPAQPERSVGAKAAGDARIRHSTFMGAPMLESERAAAAAAYAGKGLRRLRAFQG